MVHSLSVVGPIAGGPGRRLDVRWNVSIPVCVSGSDWIGVYAVGAPSDRRLGIPGEDLPGSLSAATLVSWYNAHPETAPGSVALGTAERVVIAGTGNVALDVARILAKTGASNRTEAVSIARRHGLLDTPGP